MITDRIYMVDVELGLVEVIPADATEQEKEDIEKRVEKQIGNALYEN